LGDVFELLPVVDEKLTTQFADGNHEVAWVLVADDALSRPNKNANRAKAIVSVLTIQSASSAR
jgi:hypothetical protein